MTPALPRLVLPLPPSVNHMFVHRQGPHGRRRALARPAREWRAVAEARVAAWRAAVGWPGPAADKLVVRFWIYWPDRRRRDADNLLKLSQDALVAGGVVADDRWILPQVVDFDVDPAAPRLELLIADWPLRRGPGGPEGGAA